MAKQPKADVKADAKPYTVTSPLMHDDVTYGAGDTVALTDDEANRLSGLGVIVGAPAPIEPATPPAV